MRVASYCCHGQYHKAKGMPCEDKIKILESEKYIAVCIADGVSACINAAKGADITCEAVMDFMLREQDSLFVYSEEKNAYLLIEHILYFLEKNVAENENIYSYSSTAAGALIDKATKQCLFFNLGDGAVLFHNNRSLQMYISPRRYDGRPCQTTTEGAYKAVEFKKHLFLEKDVFLIGTDGFLCFLNNCDNLEQLIKAKRFFDINEKINDMGENDDCSYIAIFEPIRKEPLSND